MGLLPIRHAGDTPSGTNARGRAMQQIEAFTAEGVVSGAAALPAGLRDSLDGAQPLQLDRAVWNLIAGGAAERRGPANLEQDDLIVLYVEGEDLPVHAQWHAVELEAGPYRITGDLPTLPGYDPGRALSRPGGLFIQLRDVRIELVGVPDGGHVERAHALVNRYAVERVASDMDFGFYFPGARFLTGTGQPHG